MILGELSRRVDLSNLTETDFVLRGDFKIVEEPNKSWKLTPYLRPEGSEEYTTLDQLFSKNYFGECYELIVQTPDKAQVVGSGYLHQSRQGDVSFGVRDILPGERVMYTNSSPVWFDLMDRNNSYQPIVQGLVDLIFVKVSPRHDERDAQRQRVLGD